MLLLIKNKVTKNFGEPILLTHIQANLIRLIYFQVFIHPNCSTRKWLNYDRENKKLVNVVEGTDNHDAVTKISYKQHFTQHIIYIW